MKNVIIITSPNVTVTANNFDVLQKAAIGISRAIPVTTIKDALAVGKKRDLYITSVVGDIIKLALRGRKNVLFWVQGILPEESAMRHSSRLRFFLLSQMERFALSHSRYLAFVSEPKREHNEKKYKMSFEGKYYIFPCYNTTIYPETFYTENKYKNNYFVYAGGLAVWQCFEKTLEIYKTVEDWGLPNTKLIVLTKNKQQAEADIISKGIKNYEIGFTTPEDLPNILKTAKFGFVIREDSPVNMVATPTKISTYLSCGLIPIFGSSVETFRRFSEKMKYAVSWSNSADDFKKVKGFMTSEIKSEDVLSEYKQFFDLNYSSERHTEALRNIINGLIDESNN